MDMNIADRELTKLNSVTYEEDKMPRPRGVYFSSADLMLKKKSTISPC